MRSDVKIGLGVGALLVIAVVVYVIAGPSEKKGEAIDAAKPSNENTSLASTANPTPAPTTTPVVIADPAPTTAPTTNTTLVVGIGGPTTQPSTSSVAIGSTGSAVTPSTQPSNSAIASARQGDYDWNNLLAGKQTPPSLSASVGSGSASSSAAANPFKTAAGKYTIKSGDTLSSIAAANYGNSSRWTDILKANPGLKPSSLRVGQTINLPEGSNMKAIAGSSAADTTSSASSSTTAVAESGKTYTVVAGDSLIKISNKVFGDSKHANSIYAINKSKIGSSPSRLKVGMLLKLPAGSPTTRPS